MFWIVDQEQFWSLKCTSSAGQKHFIPNTCQNKQKTQAADYKETVIKIFPHGIKSEKPIISFQREVKTKINL